MNYLKEASANYNCEHDGLIRPISKIDGEIIQNLSNILALRGGSDDIVEILADWKRDQDGHILNRISLCSMDAQETEDLNIKYHIIDIGGDLIDPTEIRYIKRFDEWRNDRRIYLIIINPEEFVHAKSLTKNIEVSFYNEEDRDNCLERVKEEMEKNIKTEFIKIN